MPKPKSCPGPECPGCSSPNCYAEGGEVKGVHRSTYKEGSPFERHERGTSSAGVSARAVNRYDSPAAKQFWKKDAVESHKKVLGELRTMKKPHGNYAEGGEVHNTPEHPDAEQDKELIDEELHNHMGEELMAAFDAKDKKRMMESIEAIVMSALSKE
jgi:hypothetical protein